MCQTEVRTGGREIIDKGTIISHENDFIEIELSTAHSAHQETNSLLFTFQFEDNGDSPELDTSVVGESEVKVTLLNHRRGATLGGTTPLIGSDQPIEMGVLGNRVLFFSYNVQARTDVNKSPITTHFYYNFSLGDTVDESR